MNDWTRLPDPDDPARTPPTAPAASSPDPAPPTEPYAAPIASPSELYAARTEPYRAVPPSGPLPFAGGPAPAPIPAAPPPSPYRVGASMSWPSSPPGPPLGSGWTPGAPPAPTAPPAAPRKRRPWGAVVAAVLGVLVVLGLVGALMVVANDDETSSVGEPAATATTAPVGASAPPPVSGPTSDEPIADVAKAVGPSVVLIATDEGEGSGIIYDKAGLIITNAHVVGTSRTVTVQLADGTIYQDATVVGTDTVRDVAVVRFSPKTPVVAASFGKIDDVRVGQTAVAIGSPFGLEQTVTAGIVSAVGRVISDRNPVEMIQTDAPINPGNSGGALADKQGRVIGMNTSIRTTGTNSGSVGVGFAVPADTFLNIAGRIVKGESLAVAFLGIRGSTPTSGASGVVISSVTSGSPAASAGLQAGDLITTLNGSKVTTMAGLSARVQLQKPGDTVELAIVRNGDTQKVKITLGAVR
jgi:putative serine protease PepD